MIGLPLDANAEREFRLAKVKAFSSRLC